MNFNETQEVPLKKRYTEGLLLIVNKVFSNNNYNNNKNSENIKLHNYLEHIKKQRKPIYKKNTINYLAFN